MLTFDRASYYYDFDEKSGNLIFRKRNKSDFANEASYSKHLSLVGNAAGSKNSDGYIKVYVDEKKYHAHHVIWLLKFNEFVSYPDFEIDHFDGNRGNNRLSNLRKVTKSQNQKNSGQRINNTSGVHGVNWKKRYTSNPEEGYWVARIWDGPKHLYLGSFRNIEDAKRARKEAEIRLGYTGTHRPAKGKGNAAE